MLAKCPYCNQDIRRLNLSEVNSSALFGQEWRTIIFSCPSCQKALNASIDPITIRNEIIAAIKNRI
jgi:uncharacterized protein with PIN domain